MPREKKFFENFEAKKKYLGVKSKQAKKKIENAQKKAAKAKNIAEVESVPRSIVFSRGTIGPELKSLMRNFRSSFMMPYTAKDVEIGNSASLDNVCKIAMEIWVSHLLIFRAPSTGPQMSIVRLPQGPSLHFKITEYTPSSVFIEFSRANRLPYATTNESNTTRPPIVVLNGFGAAIQELQRDSSASKRHLNPTVLKLVSTTFQHMFPPVDSKNFSLRTSSKRCVLFKFNKEDETISMRQYMVQINKANADKKEGTDKAGKQEGTANADKQQERDKKNTQKIQLLEMGPRLTLTLHKIEEGIMSGEVLYHSEIQKTPEEAAELREKAKMKKALKEQRREEQEQNVDAKREAAAERKTMKQDKKKKAQKQMENLIDQLGSDEDNEEQLDDRKENQHGEIRRNKRPREPRQVEHDEDEPRQDKREPRQDKRGPRQGKREHGQGKRESKHYEHETKQDKREPRQGKREQRQDKREPGQHKHEPRKKKQKQQ